MAADEPLGPDRVAVPLPDGVYEEAERRGRRTNYSRWACALVARVFTAAETRDVLDAVSVISDDALTARFDPQDMMAKEIYPGIWDRKPEDDDTLGYLLEYVETLRGFISQAVDLRLGMVVDIS